MAYINDKPEIKRLSIVVNALSAYDICLWRDHSPNEEDNHFIYDVFCEIANGLRTLRQLKDVQFQLGWFRDLAPFLRWDILGEKSGHGRPEVIEVERWRQDRLPIWYNPGQAVIT
jgi:hypothetical protein